MEHGIGKDEADGFKLKPNDGQLVVGEYTVAGKLTKTPEVVGNILIADPKYCRLNCFFDKESESTQPLNAIRGFKNDGEWVLVRGTMDSGASQSVAPPEMCTSYTIRESAGSKRGQKYTSASNDEIPNLGEQFLNAILEDGRETQVRYQIVDVSCRCCCCLCCCC